MAFNFNEKSKNFFKNFLDKYNKLFRDIISKDDLDEQLSYIVDQSNKITNSFFIAKNKTILLVGRVQSGKTSAFISITAKMFDSDTNLAIIIGGNDKDLFNQNLRTVNEYFDFSKRTGDLSIYSYKEKKLYESIKKDINQNKKVIIVTIKNHQALETITNELKKIENIINPLIIDDEGDQASFNNVIKNEKDGSETATFSKIKDLINLFDKYNYLTVTATPYAHVMVEDKGDFTKPDEVFVWKPGKGYLGINFFIGSGDIENVIMPITDEENKDLTDSPFVAESLKKAICFYLVNAVIYNHIYSPNKIDFSCMLLHFDRKVSKMEEMKNAIENFVYKILYEDIKTEKKNYYPYMVEAIERYNTYITNNFEEKINELTIIEKDVINYILSKLQDSIYVAVISQKNKDVILPHASTQKLFNIYIGSQMVSRGVRFPHLITSYICKRSKNKANADYLLQMCRWFGYRNKYKHLITLFLTKDLENDFYSINEGEEKLINILEYYEDNKISFKKIPRSLFFPQDNFNNNKKLIATRETIAKQQVYNGLLSNFFHSPKFKETIEYQTFNKELKLVYENLIKLIKNRPFVLKDHIKKIDNYPTILINDISELCCVFGNISKNWNQLFGINKNIDVKTMLESISKTKKILISIMTQNISDDINNIKHRNRKFIDNSIHGFNKGSSDTYVGDQYWYKQSDEYIFIQIHPIHISNCKINTMTDDNTIYKALLSCSEFVKELDNYQVAEDNVVAL